MIKIKNPKWNRTSIRTELNSEEGLTIAQRVRRMIDEGEPLQAGTGMIYSETFEEGVNPATDIRTSKHEIQENLISGAAAMRSEYLRKLAKEGKGGSPEKAAEETPATD